MQFKAAPLQSYGIENPLQSTYYRTWLNQFFADRTCPPLRQEKIREEKLVRALTFNRNQKEFQELENPKIHPRYIYSFPEDRQSKLIRRAISRAQ